MLLTATGKFNFGAGPGMIPSAVLQEVSETLGDWQGTGMSILEIGHRTEIFRELLADCERDCRELLAIPDNYQVFFLGGPARTQFSAVPLNWFAGFGNAGYLLTGLWSSLAFAEAQKFCDPVCVASSETTGFREVPPRAGWSIPHTMRWLYYTPNETIQGVRVPEVPDIPGVTLVADMTSCLFTELYDISRFGVIFAGSQKNLGPAGMTVVICRDDLLSDPAPGPLPDVLDYRMHARYQGLYATPPVFNIWMASIMFRWMLAQGGIRACEQRNKLKARKLYEFLDQSPHYKARITGSARSRVNVCFDLVDANRLDAFLAFSESCGLYALRGHRNEGGIRASLYNAMPVQGVDALIQCLKAFVGER